MHVEDLPIVRSKVIDRQTAMIEYCSCNQQQEKTPLLDDGFQALRLNVR